MAYVHPFVGTRYNTKAVDDLADVLAPPYDCISPVQQDELYERHTRNIIRIILGKEVSGDDEFNNRYGRAASLLQEWRREQVLIEDPKQSYYLYQQDFKTPDGKKHSRRGFFGLTRLQGYGEGRVRAHERTHRGPKADRYRLMRATQFNLSPIFVLYDDPKNEVGDVLAETMDKTKANEHLTDPTGVKHSMWVASNKAALKAITDGMKDKELLIADGHHRFETALHYRNEIRRASGQKGGRQPSDYLMMFLVSMDDPGLVILPTHRCIADEAGVGVDTEEVIEDLHEHFKVEALTVDLRKNVEKSAKLLTDKIAKAGKKATSMAMVLPGGRAFILTLKRGVKLAKALEDDEASKAASSLDVYALHNYIIPRIWIGNPEIELDEGEVYYTRDAVEALQMLPTRKACVTFLMNPPPMKQVVEIAREGRRMPQKTTFFYPKVISGLVMRDMRTIGV